MKTKRNKYGYGGTDSARVGVWNWLLDLEVRKTGGVSHHKRKRELLHDRIVSGFVKDAKGDSFQHIQGNWKAFTAYASKHIAEFKDEIENTYQP